MRHEVRSVSPERVANLIHSWRKVNQENGDECGCNWSFRDFSCRLISEWTWWTVRMYVRQMYRWEEGYLVSMWSYTAAFWGLFHQLSQGSGMRREYRVEPIMVFPSPSMSGMILS